MKFKHGKNFCLKDKRSIFIDKTVVIGDNVTIYENNRIEGNTVIEDGVVIMPNCYIKNAFLGLIVSIYFLSDKERFARSLKRLIYAVFPEKREKLMNKLLAKTGDG